MTNKISLTKIVQKGKTFYIMSADPRLIVSKCKYEDANKLQEYQRPWNPKRVKTIADYVHGDIPINDETEDDDSPKAQGFIPNCPLLNTLSPIIVDKDNECYIEIPEDDKKYFEILDGQHRLIAFNKDVCRLPNNERYEMGFVVCNMLTGDLKKEIFVIPNRTQEKVDKDVILSMMESLDILDATRSKHYKLLVSLNNEPSSPLKGRIKIGGEKITRGLAPKALMKILNDNELIEILDKKEPSKELEYIISYLKSWPEVYPEMKQNKSHTLNKIAGIRYIMHLGPIILDIIQDKRVPWNEENIKNVLEVLRNEITDPESTFGTGNDYNPFAGESSTAKLAKDHAKRLKEIIKGEGYDAFE